MVGRGLWHTLCVCVCVCVCVLVAQSCLTLCDPMDGSPPGCSVHGILQTRILEWVAMPSSRGSSQTRDQTQVSCTADGFFTIWATSDPTLIFLRLPKKIHMGKSNPIIQMEMEVQENEVSYTQQASRNQDLSLGLSTVCLLLFTNFISWQQSSESGNWRKSS